MPYPLTEKQFKKRLARRNPHIELAQKYQTGTVHLQFRCKAAGHLYKTYKDNAYKHGCPVCNPHYKRKSEYEITEADAWNARLNLVIEFHGSYFHSEFDKRTRVYKNTVKRDLEIAKHVNLIVVWEGRYVADPEAMIDAVCKRIAHLKSRSPRRSYHVALDP